MAICTTTSTRHGFSVIALLITVATIAIFAAIAIHACFTYTKKEKLSEVLIAIDSVAQSACEYHAEFNSFPPATYGVANLSLFRQPYATLTLENDTPGAIIIVANFTEVDLTATGDTNGALRLRVSYDASTGYIKTWDSANSTLEGTFVPR